MFVYNLNLITDDMFHYLYRYCLQLIVVDTMRVSYSKVCESNRYEKANGELITSETRYLIFQQN